MSTDKNKEQLILQIRKLAGQLGELMDSEPVDPSDAENYDYQVMTGLAGATVKINEFNPEKLFYYLGYCITSLGLDVDPRIRSLKDALENEVRNQLDESWESDKGEA